MTPTKTCTMETPGRPATLDGKPDGWTRWQTSFCMRGLPWWRWPYSKYDISNSDHDDDDQCDWLEGRWWQMEFEAKHFREFFSNWTIFFLDKFFGVSKYWFELNLFISTNLDYCGKWKFLSLFQFCKWGMCERLLCCYCSYFRMQLFLFTLVMCIVLISFQPTSDCLTSTTSLIWHITRDGLTFADYWPGRLSKMSYFQRRVLDFPS